MTVIVTTPDGQVTLEAGESITTMLTVHDKTTAVIAAFPAWSDYKILTDATPAPVVADATPAPADATADATPTPAA